MRAHELPEPARRPPTKPGHPPHCAYGDVARRLTGGSGNRRLGVPGGPTPSRRPGAPAATTPRDWRREGEDAMDSTQRLFDRHYLIRAIVGGTVGSSIEFYDFVLSANAAVLIFPRVFFPHTDPLAGILISFSTYSAGFVTRPIGAAVFGHFGDR